MFTSALCFGGGFMVSALGLYLHQLWLLFVGYGVLGGIGLGLGYISPVSTLIKWFPDRRGMATGMAIMGFGGGALIGSPLAVNLMNYFHTDTSAGIMETFIAMGAVYTVYMLLGAFAVRVPPEHWTPEGFTPKTAGDKVASTSYVHVDAVHRTPQFWLLWMVLCMNVTAGIGVLNQASLMIQEVFKGSVTAGAVAGFVGLLSIFNMGGRFVWSSVSDQIGRKPTYTIFFLLGAVLYALVPLFGIKDKSLFILLYALILSMYGGGFATIPAYLSDLFGTHYVGAIHGRLLTAWAVAGVAGPVIVNYMREYQIKQLHTPPADAYNLTMNVMAGLLVVGLICNACVKPVDAKFMNKEQ
jgi:MFS family permease